MSTSTSYLSAGKVARPSLPQQERRPASIAWMAAVGLEDGEWFHASKPALEAGMATGELKERVWCCGILASQAYQGERAMTMCKGEQIPLTPAAMGRQLYKRAVSFFERAGLQLTERDHNVLRSQVRKEKIRRALADLEAEGRAERRTDKGIPLRNLSQNERKRLPHGRVEMHFFVRPRPATPNAAERRLPGGNSAEHLIIRFPNLSAAENQILRRLLHKANLVLPPEVTHNCHFAETVKECLHDYLKDDEVAAGKFRNRLEVTAKRERIEIISVMNNSEMRTPAALGAAAAFDETTARRSAAAVRAAGESEIRDAEVAFLTNELEKIDPLAHDASSRTLLNACRNRVPDARPPLSGREIWMVCQALIQRKGGLAGEAWKKIDNPIGFLISKVPNHFPGVLNRIRPCAQVVP